MAVRPKQDATFCPVASGLEGLANIFPLQIFVASNNEQVKRRKMSPKVGRKISAILACFVLA